MSGLPSTVKVKEVGPRDGLRSESVVLATENKLRLIDCLGAAGLREIEATSFVSPKAIPALADAVEVFANLERRPGTVYSAIVPNEKGARRAVEAEADEIQVFAPGDQAVAEAGHRARRAPPRPRPRGRHRRALRAGLLEDADGLCPA